MEKVSSTNPDKKIIDLVSSRLPTAGNPILDEEATVVIAGLISGLIADGLLIHTHIPDGIVVHSGYLHSVERLAFEHLQSKIGA